MTMTLPRIDEPSVTSLDDVVVVAVTGSRSWTDTDAIRTVLTDWWENEGEPSVHLLHGDARGADRHAAQIGEDLGWNVTAFPADWDAYRPSPGGKNPAGAIRNRLILDRHPSILFAFRDGITPGTNNMIREAMHRGIPVRITWA